MFVNKVVRLTDLDSFRQGWFLSFLHKKSYPLYLLVKVRIQHVLRGLISLQRILYSYD